MTSSPILVVMGVSGAGKTTVGEAIAARLGWAFVDGDDLQPEANLAKMAGGQPLSDPFAHGGLAGAGDAHDHEDGG